MDESETVSVPHDERRRSFASYRVPLDGKSSPTSQTTPTAPFGKDSENYEGFGFIKEGDLNKEGLDFRGDGEEAGEEEGDTIDFIPKKAQPGKAVSHCHSARTALFLPYKWSPPPTANSDAYIADSLKRKIRNEEGEYVDLWEENIRLPHAVADLDPHFRQTIGWREKNQLDVKKKKLFTFQNQPFHEPTDQEHEVEPDDVCRRLLLTSQALKILFPSVSLVATSSRPENNHGKSSESQKVRQEDRICQPVIVERVEITLFPLGTAVLIIQLNWITSRAAVGPQNIRYYNPLSIEDLRTWLFLSKFRHKVVNLYEGWMLNDSIQDDISEDLFDSMRPFYGKQILKSLFMKKPASLSTIGNWLLALPDRDENLEQPPRRLGRFSKRCYHHSLVVLDGEPHVKDLQEYLFHLRRAYGQTNRPPPTEQNEKSTVDTILRPRLNRYIAMSREGTIALSWPIENDWRTDFELTKWHKRFFGVFLILAAHVQGEKSIIMELSNLSADAGTLLKQTLREDLLLDELNNVRNKLFSTATLMTRFALQMSADDCGGLSEYVEFFSALRNMFRIRPQRNELREEIQDVLLLVENSYLEEERKNDEHEIYVKSQEKKLTNLRNKRKLGGQKRFEKLVGAISSLSIPPILISGIFGMNLLDTPVFLPFWNVIAITIGLSFFLLLIFVFIPRQQKSNDEVELKAHLKEITKKRTKVTSLKGPPKI